MKTAGSLISAAFLLVAGCTYAISPDLAKHADTSIPFSQLEADPELYKGTLLILGGKIAKTTHTAEGTLIEVAQRGLDHWGRPLRSGQSAGSFVVLYGGNLDTLVYSPGREITVAGVVEGGRRMSDTNAEYPVLVSRELKLWPVERNSLNRPQYLDPLLFDPYASPRQQ